MANIGITCDCENCELKDMFFSHASNTEKDFICRIKIERGFLKGDKIFQQGDEIKDFTYLKEGLVKIYRKADNGKEQIIFIAKPLDFISLLSTFSNSNYNYSVKALEDSVTCNIDLREIKKMILANGKFAMSIIEKVSKASDDIIHNNLELKQKRLTGRVAMILLFFAKEIYKTNEFELPITRKEIADFIGKTTENVIRILSGFRKDKIIKIYGKVIEIIDMTRLEKISEFS